MPPRKDDGPKPTYSFKVEGLPDRAKAHALLQSWLEDVWSPETEPATTEMSMHVSMTLGTSSTLWNVEAEIFLTRHASGD